MEVYEYQTLFQLEDDYWWCRALRETVMQALEGLTPVESAAVLDIGCGTGGMLNALHQHNRTVSYGFDQSETAVSFLKQRKLDRIGFGSVNAIPCKSNIFDAVLCLDVLESDGIDEQHALKELQRVLKDNGALILVVPAYDWLKTKEHHEAVHASKRYTRGKVRTLLQESCFKVERMSYLFPTVFPLIAAYRGLFQQKSNRTSSKPRSELKPLPTVVNTCLYATTVLERLLLRWVDFPWGSSLLAIARKK